MLHTHVQDLTQWYHQQQQQMAHIQTMMQQQQERQAAYWRYMGFNPGAPGDE
jgi:hypothetical protein